LQVQVLATRTLLKLTLQARFSSQSCKPSVTSRAESVRRLGSAAPRSPIATTSLFTSRIQFGGLLPVGFFIVRLLLNPIPTPRELAGETGHYFFRLLVLPQQSGRRLKFLFEFLLIAEFSGDLFDLLRAYLSRHFLKRLLQVFRLCYL
jgi:hypothetical protein